MFQRENQKKTICMITLIVSFFTLFVLATPDNALANDQGSQNMYRLYNPNSGEHFYTANSNERDQLAHVGWKYEGVGWKAPVTSNIPVYRLYNPNTGDHHYTLNSNERDALVTQGWRSEGIGWYSSESNRQYPLYRQYNPNARTGSHNYTLNSNERNQLARIGWRDEGVAWYAIGPGSSQSVQPSDPSSGKPTISGITPGAWCKKSQVGSHGTSTTGALYVCSYQNGEKTPRWHDA